MTMNEHKYYANCGLHVNVWNISLMLLCFMIKRDQFSIKNKFFNPEKNHHVNSSKLIELESDS